MTSGISLKAACADNFYHPPDWNPIKISRDKFHKSKGSNQYHKFGKIRFEIPRRMYCTHCNQNISQGVRYNAFKTEKGMYFSTKIWEFKFNCHICKNNMKIETNPKDQDYSCVSGCHWAESSFLYYPNKIKKEKKKSNKVKHEKLINIPNKLHRSFIKENGSTFALRLTKNSQYIFSGGSDSIIRIYNPKKKNNALIKEFKGGHGQSIWDITIRYDNSEFASCGYDKYICLWDMQKEYVKRKLYGHNAKINKCEYNNNSNLLLSSSDDGTIMFWDLKNYKNNSAIDVIRDFKDCVTSFYTHNYTLFTASIDGHCRFYDLRMSKCFDDNIYQPITSICLSNDKKCLLLSCLDETIRLLDRLDASQLQKYVGHKMNDCMITSCFSNNDSFVISGSSNGLIHVWKIVESKQILCLQGHKGPITKIEFHSTESSMFTSGMDGKINMWSI